MSLYNASAPESTVNVIAVNATDPIQTDISLLPVWSGWWSASHHLPSLICCWRTASLGLTLRTGERRIWK